MKVLIAEDDAVSRTILRRTLESMDHQCVVAADGEEAWRLFLANADVDVVISDWMMPGLDGPELCRRIRAETRSEEREHYPFFVFLTALSGKGHLIEGLESGADDYLTKPLDRDELRARLISASRVLGLHRSLHEKQKELEKVNAILMEQSRQDSLTRLGNRLRLEEDLWTVNANTSRYGYSYSALMCDVDHFKLYNDHYGHLAGDEVLQRIANAIRKTSRTGDHLYRYGGEELLMLLPEQSSGGALAAAEKLRAAVEELRIPHGAADPPGLVTLSVGISRMESGDDKCAEDLLYEADRALYEAKSGGRNRVAVHGGRARS